ncbi:uncharacterized protein K460DRAFT_168267 [Cucurbitaria berberidis CBS 394.84]|uniref:Uncharacterized protein n=1 Tax=Cucurbitaria berberidis CBS 394.84 TaxID=1168544 RepID=A0A9P4GA34_9PLEO|nr:uncharacterized protein K460DRAFT_168267 [Cucurbitaria berberidis CBS 394.84]KAF1841479.1 hypothetical protein K460DRAFT_168267 [Cucurbitaria berberidis CBS 394.84]
MGHAVHSECGVRSLRTARQSSVEMPPSWHITNSSILSAQCTPTGAPGGLACACDEISSREHQAKLRLQGSDRWWKISSARKVGGGWLRRPRMTRAASLPRPARRISLHAAFRLSRDYSIGPSSYRDSGQRASVHYRTNAGIGIAPKLVLVSMSEDWKEPRFQEPTCWSDSTWSQHSV